MQLHTINSITERKMLYGYYSMVEWEPRGIAKSKNRKYSPKALIYQGFYYFFSLVSNCSV